MACGARSRGVRVVCWQRLRLMSMGLRRVAGVAPAIDGPRAGDVRELGTGEIRAAAVRAHELQADAFRIDEFRTDGLQGFPVGGLRACERPGASRQPAATVSSAPGWVSTGRTRKPAPR